MSLASSSLLSDAPALAAHKGSFDGSIILSNGSYESTANAADFTLKATTSSNGGPGTRLSVSVAVPAGGTALGASADVADASYGARTAEGLRVTPVASGHAVTSLNLGSLDAARIGTFVGTGGVTHVPVPSMTAASSVLTMMQAFTGAVGGAVAGGIAAPVTVYAVVGDAAGFTHNAVAGVRYAYIVIG